MKRQNPPEQRYQQDKSAGCILAFFLVPMSMLWMATALHYAVMAVWGGAMVFTFLIVPALTDTIAQMHPKMQAVLRILKRIGIAVLAALHLIPVLYFGFKQTEFLYPVRRALFGSSSFPETLPPHTDYAFIAESKLHGPDGVSSAYLVLRTDSETLDRYDVMLSKKYYRIDLAEEDPAQDENRKLKSVPEFVRRRIAQCGFDEPMEHCTLFTVGGSTMWYIGSGAVIDRESGLLIIWV